VAKVLKKGDLVILESTSPVGTTEQMSAWLAEERSDLSFPQTRGEDSDIRIAYCPERVLPGHVVRELVENDRVIGGLSSTSSQMAVELYKTVVKGECVITDTSTAEMAKLTENACRDVQIAFANELSIICDKLDINVWELISIANRHPRINILQPGPGVGGHCIAVDPWFVISKTPSEAKIIHTARKVNDAKPDWVINKVRKAIADFLKGHPEKAAKDIKIACYGLTFKPDIDDLRESPALYIALEIARIHAGHVFAVEPNIELLPHGGGEVELVDFEVASKNADIQVLLVGHSQFKESDGVNGVIIDVTGIWV
jgi:UDP-N-acetyl-D-mannosaminuronic acid dehydrogenase